MARPRLYKARALALTALVALVAPSAQAATDIATTTITRVYVNQDGLVLLRLASGQAGEACSDLSWATIDTTRPNWQQMYDLALSAYLSGRQVSVRLAGCNVYPRIAFLYLK